MRIIAGRFRGRSLTAPPGRTTRPITDQVKESLFNILGARYATPGALPDVNVLDIFSGPGSLGIEALSRGATHCTFVERDRRALTALRKNLQTLGLAPDTAVLTDNAWTMRWPPRPAGYGLIFLDPPYRDAREPLRIADLLIRLAPVLAPEGLISFRHELTATPPPPESLPNLQIIEQRRFGRMRIQFITHPIPISETDSTEA